MKEIPHYTAASRRCADRLNLGDPGYRRQQHRKQQRMKAVVDGGRWADSAWTEPFTGLFAREVRRGGVFVDVGAELGFYSYLASRLMPPDGRIIAIEPDPVHCSLLRSLFGERERIDIVEAAASDCDGEVTLVKPRGCSATRADVGGERFAAPAIVLDDLLTDVPVAIMKIDVEGAEASVFNGMRRLLATGTLKVFWEFHPWIDDIRPGGVRLIERLLAEARYRIYRSDRAQSVPPARLGGRLYLEPPAHATDPGWTPPKP